MRVAACEIRASASEEWLRGIAVHLGRVCGDASVPRERRLMSLVVTLHDRYRLVQIRHAMRPPTLSCKMGADHQS